MTIPGTKICPKCGKLIKHTYVTGKHDHTAAAKAEAILLAILKIHLENCT